MASNKQYHRIAVLISIHSFSPLSFFRYDQVKAYTIGALNSTIYLQQQRKGSTS